MVQELLQQIPAGGHFLLFVSTMQRGGTCAAHGIAAKLAILGSRDDSKRLQNPIFWDHVFKMLAKSLENGSQGTPDVDFERFSMDLEAFFRNFPWRKFILTDFKPHVQGRPAVCA